MRKFSIPLPFQVILGVAICLLSLAAYQKAFAADPPRAPVQRVAVEPAGPTWTGCGIAAHGALVSGLVDFGSPVKIGSDGMVYGVDALCDYQAGKGVIGIMASYSWLTGDIHTVGVDRKMGVSMRAGYLFWPHLLTYGRVGWSRLDTTGGDINGYDLAIGVEAKMPDAPLFVSLEAGKSFYSDVLGSTLDADALTVTTRFTWKFNLPK